MKRGLPQPTASDVWAAVARLELDVLQDLLARGGDPNASGCTPHPLVIAARRGDVAALRILLDARADPNGGPGTPDFVPLTECNSQEAAMMLLSAGANPNALNSMGNSPLHVVASRGDKHIVLLQLVRCVPTVSAHLV